MYINNIIIAINKIKLKKPSSLLFFILTTLFCARRIQLLFIIIMEKNNGSTKLLSSCEGFMSKRNWETLLYITVHMFSCYIVAVARVI